MERVTALGELGEGVVERRLPRRLGREPLEVDAQREERLGREGAPAGGGGGDERRGAALADERRVGVEEGAEGEAVAEEKPKPKPKSGSAAAKPRPKFVSDKKPKTLPEMMQVSSNRGKGNKR